jgi:VCBS repeat-containing protein
MTTSLKGFALTLLCGVSCFAFGNSYLIVHSADLGSANDVRAQMLATGLIDGNIDIVGATSGTPSLTKLRSYDAVFVFSVNGFQNSFQLGDNLAAYADLGGGVVVATHTFTPSGAGSLQGRLVSDGYVPFTPGEVKRFIARRLGQVLLPDHALMAGVSSFHGGPYSLHNNVGVRSGATLVAKYDNGVPLVAFKPVAKNYVVGLNFYSPSSAYDSNFWVKSTDGGKLMANALKFSVGIRNVAPVAQGESYSVEGGTSLAASDLLANDTDEDGNVLTAKLQSSTQNGTLSFDQSGSFVYVPNQGFTGTDTFSYCVTDGQADSNVVTVTLEVVDTTAPVLSGVPGDVVATATSASGAVVSYSTPLASDTVDGDVAVVLSQASDTAFTLGLTTVTATATDAHGNRSSASWTVWVQYSASGLDIKGSDKGSKAGSVVNVVFSLTGASAGISDASATLVLNGSVVGTFVYDPLSGTYRAQWRTKGLAAGTYTLFVDLGDGVSRPTIVALR